MEKNVTYIYINCLKKIGFSYAVQSLLSRGRYISGILKRPLIVIRESTSVSE